MYPTPPNDINDAIQNGVSMMSKRPIEMMIMGRRLQRIYAALACWF